MPSRTAEVTVAAEDAGGSVEDAEHPRLLADRDRGQVPRCGSAGEERLPGAGPVRDDHGLAVGEGEHEPDGALDRHGVVPLELHAQLDLRDVDLVAPALGQRHAVPLLVQHAVAEGGQRKLDEVAEVATLPGHSALSLRSTRRRNRSRSRSRTARTRWSRIRCSCLRASTAVTRAPWSSPSRLGSSPSPPHAVSPRSRARAARTAARTAGQSGRSVSPRHRGRPAARGAGRANEWCPGARPRGARGGRAGCGRAR